MKVVIETTFEEIPLISDLESPGSCSVDSDCLQQTSSGDSYALCSEDSFIDDDYCDEEIAAVADEAVEVRTCRFGASRFLDPWLDASEEIVEPCTLIRENLEKQQELPETQNSPHRSGSSSDSRRGTSRNRLLPTHRARVVSWMREVCEELGIDMWTFFAAVSILDRYVAAAKTLPTDGMLQLLALTSMSLAVKYHEVYRIPAAAWLSLAVTSSGKYLYQPTDLQRFEWSVLQTIGWRLHQPTTLTFLQHYMACLAAERTSVGPNQNPAALSGGAIPHTAGSAAAGVAERKGTKDVEATIQRAALPQAFMNVALQLAEISLMYGMFQSYEHSTTAMACLTMAERLAPINTPAADADRSGDVCAGSFSSSRDMFPSASATVSGCCGVLLDRLAPRLMTCVMALEKCYRLLLPQQSA